MRIYSLSKMLNSDAILWEYRQDSLERVSTPDEGIFVSSLSTSSKIYWMLGFSPKIEKTGVIFEKIQKVLEY